MDVSVDVRGTTDAGTRGRNEHPIRVILSAARVINKCRSQIKILVNWLLSLTKPSKQMTKKNCIA